MAKTKRTKPKKVRECKYDTKLTIDDSFEDLIKVSVTGNYRPPKLGKDKKMRRFWFELDLSIGKPHPPATLLGCGITDYDLNDELSILNTKVFNGYVEPKVKNIMENVDIRSKDLNHVIPIYQLINESIH